MVIGLVLSWLFYQELSIAPLFSEIAVNLVPESPKADIEYNRWMKKKQTTYKNTCRGWPDYFLWVDQLFSLAPPASSSCEVIGNFAKLYNNSDERFYKFGRGIVLLRRKANQHDPAHSLYWPWRKMIKGRPAAYAKLWDDVNKQRLLPRDLEILLYINDKPRVRSDLGLPIFVVASDFSISSGLPREWKYHIPFPSHFYAMTERVYTPISTRRPVVYFRGRLSEKEWEFFQTQPGICFESPRFKLAQAVASQPNDRDVLDIRLTGFSAVKGLPAQKIRQTLQQNFNITMGHWESADDGNATMSLAVAGNGWAGATMMRSLLHGSCTLFVHDTSVDWEGYRRDTGEVYFPWLIPYKHYVPVNYSTIASTARWLNENPGKVSQIARAGYEFSRSHLGAGCALDVIELLAWRYYLYLKTGCPSAFSHLRIGTRNGRDANST